MNPTDIAMMTVLGLHGQFDYKIQFKAGLTILHGKNAAGKTTLLHIITNLIEGDIERFLHVAFESITVVTHAGDIVRLTQLGYPGDDVSVQLQINDVPVTTVRPDTDTRPDR